MTCYSANTANHTNVLFPISYQCLSAYPYEKESLDLHREITDAARPASSAVQSKNMWKESDINPKLVRRDREKQNTE